jgi:hypothetical protein
MKMFDIVCNRKYKFSIQSRKDGFFAIPYKLILSEIGLSQFGDLDSSKEIQLFPDRNGHAWFHWDGFLFGACLNKFERRNTV